MVVFAEEDKTISFGHSLAKSVTFKEDERTRMRILLFEAGRTLALLADLHKYLLAFPS